MSEEKKAKYTVFVAQPNASTVMQASIQSLFEMSRKHKAQLQFSSFGDVAHNFNMLWCDALNKRKEQGYTHFAMLHSDIHASAWWLDTLLDEMDRTGSEVMTSVVAIKDPRYLTTTGIRYRGVWGTKRLTMREIMMLPETFGIEDVGDPATEHLAINTGCWVCRIDTGWADRFPGFTDHYRIRDVNGVKLPDFDSEDWLFSDWLAENGIKTMATRKVATQHYGVLPFGNQEAVGLWETEMQAPTKPLATPFPSPGITVETERPVAEDSLDHLKPLGTVQDSSICRPFNRRLYDLIPACEIKLLDLGCAGGGLVRTILEDGGFAVGIDGSDINQKIGRAEWRKIPDHLFTADATSPFAIRNGEPLRFNVISAWEFFEHIAEDRIEAVVENIRRHATLGAVFIGSISSNPEPHHPTARPKEWWIERLGALGITHDPAIEEHFGNRLLRGSNAPGAPSFVFGGSVAAL